MTALPRRLIAARRPSRGAPVVALVVALLLAIGVVPALAPVPVAAARPNLTLVGKATYDVLPEEGRVAVSVRLTATNYLKNTATRRFFFRSGFVTVLPGTSNFSITGGAATPKVSVSSETETYTNLRIDFGANLAAGKSTTLTLTYDIDDPGGAPDRPVRISPSLVSFAAWAVATPETPGATVDVRFPTGYSVTVLRGPLTGPVAADPGHELWSSGPLAKPLEFVADIAADRPLDYAETETTATLAGGPAIIRLRAWPDDPDWRTRVDGLVKRALPILEREIGVPWPVVGPLGIQEALVRSTGGYTGVFDPAANTIEIAYSAPDGIVLHELAHAWFNGRLIADRWAAEAFASYYAGVAADELGIDPAQTVLPEEPSPAAIPLNAWSPGSESEPETDAWAYAASLELARAIGERAAPEQLRSMWSRVSLGRGAYQPAPGSGEQGSGPPDWRGLLDLLEEATGDSFVDLWREWVARPEDLGLLAGRAVARASYQRSVALAGEWRLPPGVREAMRAWQFDAAREQLVAADAVIAQRALLESAASAAGVTLPDRLQRAFEGSAGLATAAAEATAEQAVVEAIIAAEAARPGERGAGEQLIIQIGLLGSEPDRELAAAKTALPAGDLEASYVAAREAHTAWSGAAETGRARIISTALLLIALILAIGLARELRRRQQPAPA